MSSQRHLCMQLCNLISSYVCGDITGVRTADLNHDLYIFWYFYTVYLLTYLYVV